MGDRFVSAEVVRPKVIALLQVHGPTEAVAEVTGVSDETIKKIYSRKNDWVDRSVAEKIDAAYKKIPQRRQPSRDQEK